MIRHRERVESKMTPRFQAELNQVEQLNYLGARVIFVDALCEFSNFSRPLA